MTTREPTTYILLGAHYLDAADSLLRGGYLCKQNPVSLAAIHPIQDLAPAQANRCRVLLSAGVDTDALAEQLRRSWDVTLEDDSVVNFGMPPAEWQ